MSIEKVTAHKRLRSTQGYKRNNVRAVNSPKILRISLNFRLSPFKVWHREERVSVVHRNRFARLPGPDERHSAGNTCIVITLLGFIADERTERVILAVGDIDL